MGEFRSFDEGLFYEAIDSKTDSKSLIRLKTSVISAIKVNPTFPNNNEADKALSLLHQKCPEIFEKKKNLSYEVNLPENEWDSNYFLRKTTYLQQNFCEERIDELREIGKKVYGKNQIRKIATVQKNPGYQPTPVPKSVNASENRVNKEGENCQNPPKAPKRHSKILAIALVTVVVLVLVLIVAALLILQSKGTAIQ